jgi:ribonucleoside-diphosphate reductase alpha chain
MPSTNEISAEEGAHPSSSRSSDATNGNWIAPTSMNEISPAVRRRLPDERYSLTHHFSIGGQEGYLTVGLYEDGSP